LLLLLPHPIVTSIVTSPPRHLLRRSPLSLLRSVTGRSRSPLSLLRRRRIFLRRSLSRNSL